MKYKTIISILAILMLTATTIVYAKDQLENRTPAVEPKVPVDTNQITAVEQATYTDVWTYLSTEEFSTGSGIWKDIPGMTQTITTKYPSTLAVLFTSETNDEVNIRVLLDGSELGPGAIYLNSEDGLPGLIWQSHGFNFRRDYVSKGTHTIKVQQSGNDGFTWYKSMIILVNGYGH